MWARFAQPSRLVWAADDRRDERQWSTAIAQAAPTLLAAAGPRGGEDDPLDLWRRAFALTYSAELRAERQGRSASVVDVDPERYRRFGAPAIAAAQGAARAGVDRLALARGCEGKALSVVAPGQGER